MRFVPANCLREGMQLAKTLYGRNGELLLNSGMILNQGYINSITKLMYAGVYIDDDISRDIEVVNVISDDLRNKTIHGIKNMFVIAEHGEKPTPKEIDMSQLVKNIVDELLNNKDILVNMIDLRCFDNYTYAHSVNVAVLSIIIGMSLGLKKDALVNLGLGALMHDIGKVFIDKDILNKPGNLTDPELEEIKTHSHRGYEYVKEKFRLPFVVTQAIEDHHEKYDGSGYPNEKKKEKISLFGRIIAISDVYDALTSERPYRKALNPSESMEYIMGGSGTLFDPKIVKIFLHKIAPYPVGTTVKLSNDWIGIVVENFEFYCLRPTIRVIRQNGIHVDPFEISLRNDDHYLNVTVYGVAEY